MYQNVFTIRLLSGDIKSFSYIDVLTKTVELMTEKEEGYKSILPETMGPDAKIRLL